MRIKGMKVILILLLMSAFNQDISEWNVRNVETMYGMFYNAHRFNQILTNWCVDKVSKNVEGFADKSGFEDLPGFHPRWGTCP